MSAGGDKPKGPSSSSKFVHLLPKHVREEVADAIGISHEAALQFEKKLEVAKRIDKARARKADPADNRLRKHQADIDVAAMQRAQRGKHAAPRRRPKSGTPPAPARTRSKRRARGDAFEERGRTLLRSQTEHLEKYTQKLKMLGQWDAAPVGVKPFVWRCTQLIQADPSALTGKILLSSLPPAVARRIRRAALEPEPYAPMRQRKGRTLRQPRLGPLYPRGRRRAKHEWEAPGLRRWTHRVAIRTVAIGVGAFHQAQGTRRDGFRRVVRGLPRGLICSIAQHPYSLVRPSKGTLFGNHDSVPGDVRALEQAGVFQVRQPPGAKVEPRDKGPSGFAFNNYWFFPWTMDSDRHDDAELAELSRSGLRAELLLGPEPTAAGPPRPS